MNIGDKIRLLHSKEEGIITKILPNNMFEVEIEEGFGILLHKSEIVAISPEEERRFGNKTTSFVKFGQPQVTANPFEPIQEPKLMAQRGLFVGFLPFNDNLLIVHFINNTDFDLLFSLGIEKTYSYKGIIASIIAPKSAMRVHEVELKEFENWGTFVWQCLFFSTHTHKIKLPFTKKLRFKAKSFFNHQKELPILSKKGYVFQLDENVETEQKNIELIEVTDKEITLQPSPETLSTKKTKTQSKQLTLEAKHEISETKHKTLEIKHKSSEIKLDAQKLREEMLEKKTCASPHKVLSYIKPPKREIDLHIEALTDRYDQMNSQEMLELQLKTFERTLQEAIAVGMPEIIFIHGVGNGKLKQEIHKLLKQNKEIKGFEEAQREKFGYGATLVRIK
ncbi:MAG: Smr/MutS family protein [Microscillaceae bacterium]|nr:Smr/MutS family protein [Microscillaceae bacterium]MDW8461544.1 Smr/MutS family protein [Cytophagales bacterium]